MRIFREEVFGAGVQVGEVAAASSGDEDFFAGLFGVVDEEDAAVVAAGFDSAEESGCARSEDDYVELVDGCLLLVAGCVRHCWGLVLFGGIREFFVWVVCQCHFWVSRYLLRFSRLYQNGIRLRASAMNGMEYFVAWLAALGCLCVVN